MSGLIEDRGGDLFHTIEMVKFRALKEETLEAAFVEFSPLTLEATQSCHQSQSPTAQQV
ncbi:hypothetical protein [Marinobacter sp. F4216]|uniref:hypothetical protein n=1 Tax=Marinobacter sp. F4216 TaxID=2874281 RepID=UPI001CBC3CCB|nr:hypothetical protein [Marinobacter sp. F4216]